MKYKKFIYSFIGLFMFVVGWQMLHAIYNDAVIVSIDKIFASFIYVITSKEFVVNLLATLKIEIIGIAIAIVVGISVGVIADLNKRIKWAVMPIVSMFRNVPSITLFPILLVLYGIGDMSRIFVIFWTAVPPIILSTLFGIDNVDICVIEAGEVAGANKTEIMFRIKLPLAFGEILNGIKVGIGSGFVAIVVAEMLGASKGIGFMVLWATNAFKYSETYAYILVIALVGALFNLIMEIIIKKYRRNIL